MKIGSGADTHPESVVEEWVVYKSLLRRLIELPFPVSIKQIRNEWFNKQSVHEEIDWRN